MFLAERITMLSLIRFWQLGVGALAGLALAWCVNVLILQPMHTAEIERLRNDLIAQCEADKKITSEVSNELQKRLAGLNNRLATLKRVQPSACVPVTNAASGHDATAAAGQPVRAHGINAASLYDFAGEAEQYRLQLIACQDFILRTWQDR
jgi:hypothetical protein